MTAIRTIVPPGDWGWVTRRHYDAVGDNPIGWCGWTLNPIRGCSEVSGRKECGHVDGIGSVCYSCHITQRHQLNPQFRALFGLPIVRVDEQGEPHFTGLLVPNAIDNWTNPFRQTRPTLCFIGDMSDLFHENLPDEIILTWLRIVHQARWVTFQALTKRHVRMKKIMERLYLQDDGLLGLTPKGEIVPWDDRPMLENLWLGVTVGMEAARKPAIKYLKETKATVRYLSMEPLFDPIDISGDLTDGLIHWVIVGGESGSRMRDPSTLKDSMQINWVRSIRDACVQARVALFFKQGAGPDPQLLPPLDGICWPWLPKRPTFPVPLGAERKRLRTWAEAEYRRVVMPWAATQRAAGDHINSRRETAEHRLGEYNEL